MTVSPVAAPVRGAGAPSGPAWRWLGSLRLRLLAATLASLLLALAAAHGWLAAQFREHVLAQFDLGLVQQLDQLTARLVVDAAGRPEIGPRGMSDPRWEQVYSGLYWQVERLPAPAGPGLPALRSRSLWDAVLRLPDDALADGALHRHTLAGPRGEALRAVERSLQPSEAAGARWRLVVAGDPRDAAAAVARFGSVLTASLSGLGLLLALAAGAQLVVGLAPLGALQRGLQQVREGRARRLAGRHPSELQPLVDAFNAVLARQEEGVAQARAEAGNLAHALKTPLAILREAARQAGPSEFSALVAEQVQAAERQVQWQLARARLAAVQPRPGQRAPVAPVVERLLRAMNRLHAARHLDLGAQALPPGLAFAGDAQDLEEMLGNLLDNACRHARSAVEVQASREGGQLVISVDDDGPGIPEAQRARVLQRGVRLDERGGGSGLGLAIVVDLARRHGGDLVLARADAGGLRARLLLPAAG